MSDILKLKRTHNNIKHGKATSIIKIVPAGSGETYFRETDNDP